MTLTLVKTGIAFTTMFLTTENFSIENPTKIFLSGDFNARIKIYRNKISPTFAIKICGKK
jgi:hypothetical protein